MSLIDELPHAIKTGMIATHETMELIQHYLKQDSDIPYVIDPVMLAKVVIHLWMMILRNIYRIHYYLLADVVTPNIPEAEEITGIKIDTEENIRKVVTYLLTR